MAIRIRGQEVTIRVAIDGALQAGTYTKAQSFEFTTRDEINEEDYIGEDQSDLDYRYDGYDYKFESHMLDALALQYVAEQESRQRNRQAPQNVTITVLFGFRDAETNATGLVLYQTLMRVPTIGVGGRKEYVANSFEGKGQRFKLITQ